MVACLLERPVGTAARACVLVRVVRPVVALLGEAEADDLEGAMTGREGASSDPTGNKRRSDPELVRAEVSSSGEEEPPSVGSGVLVIVMFPWGNLLSSGSEKRRTVEGAAAIKRRTGQRRRGRGQLDGNKTSSSTNVGRVIGVRVR